MSTTNAQLLTDPEGSKMLLTRVDDIVITATFELAPGADCFRLFEDDRIKLREFLSGKLV